MCERWAAWGTRVLWGGGGPQLPTTGISVPGNGIQTALLHAPASAEPQQGMGRTLIFRSLGRKRRHSCSKSYKILQNWINLYWINPALLHILIANDSLLLWEFNSTWSLFPDFSLLRHSERHDMRPNFPIWVFPFKSVQDITKLCPLLFVFFLIKIYTYFAKHAFS